MMIAGIAVFSLIAAGSAADRCGEAERLAATGRDAGFKDPDGAIASLRKAVELCPSETAYREGLGNALWASKRLDEALAVLDKGLRDHQDAGGLHYLRGQVLRDMGKDSEALGAMLVADCHGDPRARLVIDDIQANVFRRRPERLVSDCKLMSAREIEDEVIRVKGAERPVVSFGNIRFDLGRDEPQQRSMPQLNALAEALRGVATDRARPLVPTAICLTGHVDRHGFRRLSAEESARRNRELSLSRARAVAQWLGVQLRGTVAPSLIHARGKGFDEPLDPGTSAGADQRNRRVTFSIHLAGEDLPSDLCSE